MHRIQAGTVAIGHDRGHNEALCGVETPGVLAGAQGQATHAEGVCLRHARQRQDVAQALAVQPAVNHAPAECSRVLSGPHQAAAGNNPAGTLHHQVVMRALVLQQVVGEIRTFVGAEVLRHVAVEYLEAGARIGSGEEAKGGHGIISGRVDEATVPWAVIPAGRDTASRALGVRKGHRGRAY